MIVVEVHDHLEAVVPELVVEQPVGGLDGGDDGHQVEGLTEGKAELVAAVLVAVVNELVGNFLGLTKLPSLGLVVLLLSSSSASILLLLLSVSILLTLTGSTTAISDLDPVLIPVLLPAGEDVTYQLIFEVFLPNRVRQFAEEEEEGQEVGQPEVVGGDRAIVLRDIVLVHETSSGSI